MKTRSEALGEIESRAFDVCVIGAGATGAGCALDAQLRGLRTVLIDAGDFASSTSSASTKLAHGGVRYLQQAVAEFDFGQLRVIREALRERRLMLDNAPHLAHPREFLVPCFSRFELWYYALGLKVYDWVAAQGKLGETRRLSREMAISELPTLTREGLVGSVCYWDGQFDDARYCVALVKTFTDAGGEVCNYLKVVGFEKDVKGRPISALVEDRCTQRLFRVSARTFVNATGPFSDRVRSLANPALPERLVLSKGVHIVLPLVGDITSALLIPKTEDGRVLFAIPWLGRLLVGTTDQEVTLDQDLAVTRDEAEYLLRHLNRYSTLRYTPADIVSAFAGVRPLVRPKHARETSKMIREHEVEVDGDSGLISILGGKWTTYRAMAEDTIDVVQMKLGICVPCKTRHHRLVGADGYNPDDWRLLASEYEISEATARHVMQKFGSEASFVMASAMENPELKSPLIADCPMIQAEVVFCARYEMVMTIEDVLARRLGLQFFSWRHAIQAASTVAALLARELGWSTDQTHQAVDEYVHKMEGQFRTLAASGSA